MNLGQIIQEMQDEYTDDRSKSEEAKKDIQKKVTMIFRDLEKFQLAMERKVNLDLFNERVESKADKQMVLNAVINKVSKVELEQIMHTKCDKRDVEAALQQFNARLEEEVLSLNEGLAAKASIEDIQYYRKELGFKLEKSELEAFRQDFVDRVTNFDKRLCERNQLLQQFGEALEGKIDGQLIEFRHTIQSQLDQKLEQVDFHCLKQDMRD